MAFEFKLPDLGEGIHEAEVLAVKVAAGSEVKEDQPIFEVETDKAVVEIPSPVAGVVEKIHVKEGQLVTVGSVMITIATAAQDPAAAAEKARTESRVPAKAAAREATNNGGQKASGAPAAGPVPAAPAVRRMAREMGVDLRNLRGSGPAGRVLKEDLRAYAEGVVGSALAPAGSAISPLENRDRLPAGGRAAEPPALPDFSRFGPLERQPLKSLRRKIAENMTQSWIHIPRVTTFDEADITQLDDFLKKNDRTIAERGARMTLTVFMIKAVVSALKRFPQFNASLDEAAGEIVLKRYYNIGIAVATDRGLIVPVIHDADKKTLTQLALELKETAAKTRDGKIELDRLQGGTFTITNIGAIGGTGSVPMVNHPEAAILGMAKASRKPVVRNEKIEIGTILPLTLSFDHRIVDGAEAASFLRHVANCLEEPLHLLLEE